MLNIKKLEKVFGFWMVLLLVGCFSQIKQPDKIYSDTDKVKIEEVIDTFVQGYNHKNINLIEKTISRESSFYNDLIETTKNDFKQYSQINLEFRDIKIDFYDEKKRAVVTLRGHFEGIETKGKVKNQQSRDIFELAKSKAGWVIVYWYKDIFMKSK